MDIVRVTGPDFNAVVEGDPVMGEQQPEVGMLVAGSGEGEGYGAWLAIDQHIFPRIFL